MKPWSSVTIPTRLPILPVTRQESKDALTDLGLGARNYGEFHGEGAVENAIRTGKIDPTAVHVYHTGDGKVQIVESLDRPVDSKTANASLAAHGVVR